MPIFGPPPGSPEQGVYATVDDIKERVDGLESSDDDRLEEELGFASRWVDQFCNRFFYADADATARTFRPRGCESLIVDDISTTDDLAVATGTDGTFTTAWAATDYETGPDNALVRGVPITRLNAVGSYRYSVLSRSTVQVTAKWGWPAIPEPIKLATILKVIRFYKLPDAPFGVAGFNDFGAVRISREQDPESLLRPFRIPVMG